MAEKSARSKEIEHELTLRTSKEQITELGKKRCTLHMKKLQKDLSTLTLNPIKWMNFMIISRTRN